MTKLPHHSEFDALGQEETGRGEGPVGSPSPVAPQPDCSEEAAGDTGKRCCVRHDIDIWGRFRYAGRGYEVVLLNLSTTGCRFFDRHGSLGIGTQIRLKIAGIGPFEAEVRWRQGGYVGLMFCTVMYDPVLEHIVALSREKK